MACNNEDPRRCHACQKTNSADRNKSTKSSTADWENNRRKGRWPTKNAQIGAYYRKKAGEKLYERRYLNGSA